MEWTALKSDVLSWLHFPDHAPAPDQPPSAKVADVDPYLLWADLTKFSGYSQIVSFAQKVPVAVQVIAPADFDALIKAGWLESPSFYRGAGAYYATGYVQPKNLASIHSNPQVRRLELGLPLAYAAVQGRPVLTPQSEGDKTTSCQPLGDTVVGLIDLDCAFLNKAFRRAGSTPAETRICALWQQGEQPIDEREWTSPAKFGYGRELTRDTINTLLAGVGDDPQKEYQTYRGLGFLYDKHGRLEYPPHGTHVLDTAAGLVDSQAGPASSKPRVDDAASRADLIVVQVPRAPKADTTGASLSVHLIDALNYIVDRAGSARNIVVNVSIGAQAGPHDGSSTIERAIEDIVKRHDSKKNLVVVMAAGNGFESKCHAEGVVPANGMAEFTWRVLPDDDTDSFLELWFDVDNPSQLTVELQPPFGPSSGPVRAATARTFGTDAGVTAAVMHCEGSATGDGLMAMLAVGPSKASARRSVLAPHGMWTVRLHNGGTTPANFFAWVERDDPPVGSPGTKRQSYLADLGSGSFVTGRGTLNNIATGMSPVVVAACDLASNEVTRYSAAASRTPAPKGYAANRMRQADVIAAADESASFEGLEASGILSGQRHRMGGTSVAAPVVTRKIANLLSGPGHKGPWTRTTLIDGLGPPGMKPRPPSRPSPPNRPSGAPVVKP